MWAIILVIIVSAISMVVGQILIVKLKIGEPGHSSCPCNSEVKV